MIIARESLYVIEADPDKNRIYITLRGTWRSHEDVPQYLEYIHKALELVRPGFSVLTDVSELGEPTEFSMAIHKVAQRTVVNRGLKKTAEVFPLEKSIEDCLVSMAASSSMVRRSFHCPKQAERWLDSESLETA